MNRSPNAWYVGDSAEIDDNGRTVRVHITGFLPPLSLVRVVYPDGHLRMRPYTSLRRL